MPITPRNVSLTSVLVINFDSHSVPCTFPMYASLIVLDITAALLFFGNCFELRVIYYRDVMFGVQRCSSSARSSTKRVLSGRSRWRMCCHSYWQPGCIFAFRAKHKIAPCCCHRNRGSSCTSTLHGFRFRSYLPSHITMSMPGRDRRRAVTRPVLGQRPLPIDGKICVTNARIWT